MTVVVGYLDTPPGHAALEHSIDEALRRDSQLLVVVSARTDPYLEDTATDELDTLRGQLDGSGVRYEIRRLVRGREAADEIIDVADEVDAALIVVGIRHRSPVGKLLLGSTAQQILLTTDRPVLAVKAGTTPRRRRPGDGTERARR
jgi:nucleotide-binding universal stress UspA family protein